MSICTLASVILPNSYCVRYERDGEDEIFIELVLDTVKPLVSNHLKCEDLKRSLTESLQELVAKKNHRGSLPRREGNVRTHLLFGKEFVTCNI